MAGSPSPQPLKSQISNLKSPLTPTVDYIKSCFDEYNALFFGNSLPPIPVKLSSARTFLGKVTFTRRRSWLFGPLRNENFVLRINTRLDLPEELIQDTIIHEMIHYYIAVNQWKDTSTHGKLFRREMARINAEGNRHISISYRLSKEQQIELYPERKEQIEAFFLRKSQKCNKHQT